MAFKNHSQIEELRLSEEELWRKKVRRVDGNPLGIETSLGHSYSTILEELAREGLDSTPKPGEFLNHIKASLVSRGNAYESRRTTMETPTYFSTCVEPVLEYMKSNGLSRETRFKVMLEIWGTRQYEYLLD